jgi:uncharacterized membrane protein YkvA (DUF1232 family)
LKKDVDNIHFVELLTKTANFDILINIIQMTNAAFSPTNYIDEIKLAVEGHHELPLIVQNAHIVFNSLLLLVSHPDIPAKLRARCFTAIGYFFVPEDVISEKEFGPIGFVEDVMLAIFVHYQIIETMGKEGEEAVEQAMAGSTQPYSIIQQDYEQQRLTYERQFLSALRLTGLISDDEYSNIIN